MCSASRLPFWHASLPSRYPLVFALRPSPGFGNVQPKTAEALANRWKQVRLSQPYSDDGKHSRTLTLAPASISQLGFPITVIAELEATKNQQDVAKLLVDAAAKMKTEEYSSALALYQSVLRLEQTNPAAQKGRDDASSALAKQEGEIAKYRSLGEWLDHPANILWTIADNGQDINWKDAVKYCRGLHTGGSTKWRLPTEEELKSIYNPSLASNTVPSLSDHYFQDESGNLQKIPKGSYAVVHISGGLALSQIFVWSSKVLGGGAAQGLNYENGELKTLGAASKEFSRALCVRNVAPATE